MNGQWSAAATCPYACVGNACGGVCVPGSAECVGSDAVHECGGDGQWGAAKPCAYVCIAADGKCGKDEKIAFLSSQQFKANMGGLRGADDACQTMAQGAGLPGSYFAWLSDDRQSPATRFKRGGPYVRVDGNLIAENWTALTSGNLVNKLVVNEFGGAGANSQDVVCAPGVANAVWTATASDGTGVIGQNCDNWTNNSAIGSFWGASDSTSAWTAWCSGGVMSSNTCGSISPIYCFQQ